MPTSKTQPQMSIAEILGAIHGATLTPYQPEGGHDVLPLTGHHLSRPLSESAPANVTAAQGAGQPGNTLAPGGGEPTDGRVHVGGNSPDSSGGPLQLPASSSPVPGLTGDGSQYHGRPEGAPSPPFAAPAPSGPGQVIEQGRNPRLTGIDTGKSGGGLFGKPGV